MQTKCKLNNAELFLKPHSEQRNWKQKVLRGNENLKNDHGIVRFRLNIDVIKEKGDSWLNAIKTNIAFVKGRLNISSKSATTANNDQRITMLP